MQKEIIELFEKSGETALESARKVGELNQRTFDTLFQQQADLAAFYLDAGSRSLELLTKAKGYQELMAGQTALLRECGERYITALRQSVSFAQKSAGEYGTLFQESAKQAQEQMAQASSLSNQKSA